MGLRIRWRTTTRSTRNGADQPPLSGWPHPDNGDCPDPSLRSLPSPSTGRAGRPRNCLDVAKTRHPATAEPPRGAAPRTVFGCGFARSLLNNWCGWAGVGVWGGRNAAKAVERHVLSQHS
jgi:hypothetical protein